MTSSNTLNDIETVGDDNDKSISSSTSDSSDECPFNADIASKLTAAFAKATGIDIEFAVQLLKDNQWNIDRALKATYQAKEQAQSVMYVKKDWKSLSENYFKILSWNTDTADSDEIEVNELIEQRTDAMVELFLREKPDVIFLQQVGTISLTLIITSLSSLYDDESVQIDSPDNSNYVSIFTRKSTMKKSNVSMIKNNDNWRMLKVEVEYKNSIKIDLFNAFIDDNTCSFSIEQIYKNTPNHISLFGMSSQISDESWASQTINLDDLWEMTEQRPETLYTYDPELNTNITENKQPQRYDKILFRLPTSMNHRFKPVHMELEGIKHIKTSDTIFPSKHWAVQGYFEIEN